MNLSRGFQFPLHRDPRCNSNEKARVTEYLQFQFPLHRDPRCNADSERILCLGNSKGFSSLYIGILAATNRPAASQGAQGKFQFPLHRDPRCNAESGTALRRLMSFSSLYIGILAATATTIREHINVLHHVSVPFTSGSSLQHGKMGKTGRLAKCFSSLYIGILAATIFPEALRDDLDVSVPFTSGSSLQLACSYTLR